MSGVTVEIEMEMDTEEEAEEIGMALSVDDDDYVKTTVEGSRILAHIKAEDIDGARRAADDWMACFNAICKESRNDS